MTKLRIYLIPGQHAKRTPFAYSDYRPFFTPYFEFVSEPLAADFIVASYFVDLRAQAEHISRWLSAKPQLQLVVFSEEPLWDLMTQPDGEFSAVVSGKRQGFVYHCINHKTSDVFNFERIPYFITTENHYIQRYLTLLQQNAVVSPSARLKHWQTAQWQQAFFAEKRTDLKYNKQDQQNKLVGLSVYRSDIASLFWQKSESLIQGRGWHNDTPRQSLPDWHLDKLTTLHNNTKLLSSIENTILPHYLTEKPFDAYACNAVPIVYAAENSRLFELIGGNSKAVLNIYGKSAPEAAEFIQDFLPDISIAESYMSAQQHLINKLGSFSVLFQERERVAFSSFVAFERLLSL
ncbi:hypothetical protein [Rheinheimera baltica]|uniref:hypothetical protein n=1 Tax=Rheinheimera baltica TaxID=67576 RepID=UPI00273DBC0C|nr:hypothetical protein [Rheinheimera baltica]MDP5143061.1 hypothetical protein [Rheinheimera baltica]MDP5191517.1 hypothetical protein [Rheinheimera baltica]